MTVSGLQDALAKEIENITKSMIFIDRNGKKEKLTAYKQNLPVKEAKIRENENENGEEYLLYEQQLMALEDSEPFPYCVVRIENGRQEDAVSAQYVDIYIFFGIYDPDKNVQGHKRILNIIQRIMERFYKNPVLDGKYVMRDEEGKQRIQYDAEEDRAHSYFFGGMSMTWCLPSIRRENEYS